MNRKMKKFAYIAAALAVLAGCSKTEIAPETAESGNNISLSLRVAADNGATKAAFDGTDHITFAAGDKLAAAIAKPEAPTTAIYVSYQDKGYQSRYYTNFTIADEKAAEPVFNGTFYSVSDSDKAEEYCLYGVFPDKALYTVYSEDKLDEWVITLPNDQSDATQASWGPKENVMLLKPATIKCNASESYSWGEFNSSNDSTAVQMAHIFGYARIDFADIPAEYQDLAVKSISIKAVGDDQVIAGRFYVDVTKTVDENTLEPLSKNNTITIKPAETIAVKDYVAWIAAKPGTFDVEITVVTGKADLIFSRSGLQISRGKIAKPTVHFKTTDTASSHDVALAEGENWLQTFSYSNCLTSSYTEREWGPAGKKMIFSLSYPGSENANYGYYGGSYSTGYVQYLAYKTISGGKAVLSSAAEFSGISLVKANFGIYTKDATCDFTVSLVSAADTTKLGTVSVTGDNSNYNGKNFYFENKDNKKGQLVITADNFSNADCYPYVGVISLNPTPDIEIDTTPIKLEKTDSTGTRACVVYAASGEPTVTVSEDATSWLSASYKDSQLTYTATANTGAKRIGTITITAKGTAETSKTITVSQASATAVEFKLSVSAADVKAAVDAALAGAEATDEYKELKASFNAVSTSDATVTLPVEIDFTSINYSTATAESFVSKAQIYCTSEVGEIENVVVVANNYVKSGNWDELTIKLSSDGKDWNDAPAADRSYTGTSDPYTSTVNNSNDSYTWFNIKTGWGSLKVYSFEVTFVAD